MAAPEVEMHGVDDALGSLAFQDLAGLLALAQPVRAAPQEEGLEEAEGEEQQDAGVAQEAESNLRDQFQLLQASAWEGFWKRVLDVGEAHLKGPAPTVEPGAALDAEETATPEELQEHEANKAHASAIRAMAEIVVTFADVCLNASTDPDLPPSFQQVLQYLQEMVMATADTTTQGMIARALEKVAMNPFTAREYFFGGTIMMLISKCLSPRTTSADVTRLYKCRELLAELEWEDESSEHCRIQLLHCIASPVFVRATHGPDVVAACWSVHPSFVSEVHLTIKNHVLQSRVSILKGYAVALHKAWRNAKEANDAAVKIQLEHCIQDYALLAVRTAKKSADKARAMLEEVHRQHRAQADLTEVLCSVYKPILWRSLKVANCQVRENAARLLQYVFPLVPKTGRVVDDTRELGNQVRILKETLTDPSPAVRSVAVTAVCVILKNYWEAFSADEMSMLMAELLGTCLKDSKAPTVRAAVIEGLGIVLENPMSHPTLEQVLPSAEVVEMLEDRIPMVRAAFVTMLAQVSKCRTVHVSSIVSNDKLMLRMIYEQMEGQAERLQKGLQKKVVTNNDAKASPELVAKLIAKLVAPSLFLEDDIKEQVKRCHHLMLTHPLALLSLLMHVPDTVSVTSRVKLAAGLFRYGLQEAGRERVPGSANRDKQLAMWLRAAGVLLEGSCTELPAGSRKRKKDTTGTATGFRKLPKELESFVYENIREEDFMHLLRSSSEDGGAASQLQEDLLFTLSHLDPERLTRTSDLVNHELVMATRGDATQEAPSIPRLTALMRAAVRWELLGTAMETAWERLQAAAVRLGRRQAAPQDLTHAVAVIETAMRDTDIRAAVLKTDAGQAKASMQQFVKAFRDAWSTGLGEARSPAQAGVPSLLGPAAPSWPRVIGLVVRSVLHLERRSAVPAPGGAPKGESKEGEEGADTEEIAQEEKAAEAPAEVNPMDGLAEETLEALAGTLVAPAAEELLGSLEERAKAKADAPREAVRKKSKGTMVSWDIEAVFDVHERVIEALQITRPMSNLRPMQKNEKGELVAAYSSSLLLQARQLEELLWRWASVADVLQPSVDGPRLNRAFVFSGQLVVQSLADSTTPDILSSVRRLYSRVTETVPKDTDLRAWTQTLCTRLDFEPSFVALVAREVGDKPTAPELDGLDPAAHERHADAGGKKPPQFHERVAKVMEDLIPSFRNLRQKLRPEAKQPAPIGEDPLFAEQVQPTQPDDIDGESVTDVGSSRPSLDGSRRGSHIPSPAPPSDVPSHPSLFDSCFAGAAPQSSNDPSPIGDASADATMSETGEEFSAPPGPGLDID